MRQQLASRRWLFHHQPTFHVCGNAKLSGFSDGFGSLRSGWQLFGICQRFGCSGIPIVTVDIVARLFHIMILAANLAQRKANRSRWIPSDRLRQPACERDRISGIRRYVGRTPTGLSRLLKATSELGRISDSGAVRGAKDMLMALGDIRPYRAPRSGGSTTLSVTDGCREGRAVMRPACAFGFRVGDQYRSHSRKD
jgi:hypothetical protein